MPLTIAAGVSYYQSEISIESPDLLIQAPELRALSEIETEQNKKLALRDALIKGQRIHEKPVPSSEKVAYC